ncbi:hypothetical protein [Paraburkholderia sp. RL17-337-BIB-A]|uniref:hypothetical protein n=1 Tax=Paraburkholderia sp. RL17-337-BIB-A TaxID=3031636 RepID=UPI0038BBF6F3
MVWLTAAPHIETYKVLKQDVTEPSHNVLREHHEEYWWHCIYLAIDMYDLRPPSWYDEDRATEKSGLTPPSLLIVYRFASWPAGKDDLIGRVDLAGIVASCDLR